VRKLGAVLATLPHEPALDISGSAALALALEAAS